MSRSISGQVSAEEAWQTPARSQSVLIVAWEYPRFHSRQGTALARRIGQIARGFARAGWCVSVVHPRQTAGDPAESDWVTERVDSGEVRRRAIGSADGVSRGRARPSLVRKAVTMWNALRYGDRSGRWADEVEHLGRQGALGPHSLVIGCFTPRGPLRAAAALHRLWHVPWIADLQDPWWEGTSTPLRRLVAHWMRRTLRTAAAVIQVSPEWADESAMVLRRPVEVMRHAVPHRGGGGGQPMSRAPGATFTILYAGSLNEDCQDLRPFLDALRLLKDRRDTGRPIVVRIAGSDAVWQKFLVAASARGVANAFEHVGWLTESELHDAMVRADALLMIPWFPSWRRGVPSKMYEYVVADTPILIAGRDSGGVRQLLTEWGHPPAIASEAGDIAEAIRLAEAGDPSRLFERARCQLLPLSDMELGARSVKLAQAIVDAFPMHSSRQGEESRP